MRTILAALVLVQAAPAQSEAEKFEAALKKIGDREYLILMEGKKVGTCSFKTRVEKEGTRNVAIFEDRMSIRLEGMESSLQVTEKASTDRLRLISAKRTTRDGGKPTDWTLSVTETKATIESGGEKKTVEITPATIGEHSTMRMVCAADQKVGASFTADVFSGVGDQLQPGHSFKCVAKEQIEIGGKKFDAFKWENKGEWKTTHKIDGREVPGSTKVENTFWISPDGYMLKSAMPGGELVLDFK